MEVSKLGWGCFARNPLTELDCGDMDEGLVLAAVGKNIEECGEMA